MTENEDGNEDQNEEEARGNDGHGRGRAGTAQLRARNLTTSLAADAASGYETREDQQESAVPNAERQEGDETMKTTRNQSRNVFMLVAVVGMLFALAPAAQAAPIVTPGDGYTGAYRLAFVTGTADGPHTNGTATATSADIGYYNTHVTNDAAGVAELNDLGATWKCIGSTLAVSARANTRTYIASDGGLYDSALDVPIYTTTGLRIADSNADLWDGSIANAIAHNEGTPIVWATSPLWDYHRTWTGTNVNGDPYVPGDGDALGNGSPYVRTVYGGATNSGWISQASNTPTNGLRLLALSDLIGAAQEGFLHIIKFFDIDGDGEQGPNEPRLPQGMFDFDVFNEAGDLVGTFPNCVPDIPLPLGNYTAREVPQGDWYVTSGPIGFEITGGLNEVFVGNAVPEPATMALLSLAACGLGGYVRKRRKA